MAQRVIGVLLLLVAGMASLPLAALPFDGEGSENWIVPVQLAAMAAVGAAVSMLLPGLAGDGVTTSRRVWVGAALGIAMALVGVAVFFPLLNGFSGA